MLASRHKPEQVLSIMGCRPCVFETKFDGERIQVHKNDKEIRLFSRYTTSSFYQLFTYFTLLNLGIRMTSQRFMEKN